MIIDPHLVGSWGWLEWSGGGGTSPSPPERRVIKRWGGASGGWRVEGDLPLTHSFDLPSEEENGGLRGILLEEERTDSGF